MKASNLEASANFAMTDMQQQQLAAKDDEIRDLVTSDNKVIVDLSKYVETLEQKIVMLRETLQQKKAVDMLFATEAGTE